jgi:hypothetical protein
MHPLRTSHTASIRPTNVDGAVIDRAIEAAFARTVRRHRQLGLPLIVWRNGRVMEVSASDIALQDDGQLATPNTPVLR